ncbi:splicing factor, suppressor of white-apricot homolog [Hetaerina americana]|uniref:splicing factor, suppressor of white-apricot homolog n=1 Tax=Hetaerina americana TaxID=62018 RepID=UPI003A7F27D5
MAVPRQNWHLSDAGILRKKEDDDKLLVFGYSCKIFRDDEKALFIDQGKHLIPWMGNEALKIDRYDGRAALADLRESEAPIGGYVLWASLSDAEKRVEQLCDEERYRALTHNEEEEALYQEEELKRLQQALSAGNTYGQVAYQYDESGQPVGEHKPEGNAGSTEEDEPFVAPQELDIPSNMVLPETVKANAIIEKTAMFINEQGAQMEILLKMKQAKNPQFQFLSFDDPLHSYYRHLLMAIKTGRYRPKPPKEEAEDEDEQDDEDDEYYLHPSLASSASRIELAPSIPSINYKPSADCAYSMLVNKIRDKQAAFVNTEESSAAAAIAKAPLTSTTAVQSDQESVEEEDVEEEPEAVGYGTYKSSHGELPLAHAVKGDLAPGCPAGGMGRKRRKRRGARRKRRSSGGGEKGDFSGGANMVTAPPIIEPPPEMQIVIDKMASYVAKNGRDFETIVKSKGDPRFSFLEATHRFNSYYILRLQQYELQNAPQIIVQDGHQPSPAKKARNGSTKSTNEEPKEEPVKPTEQSKAAILEKEASKCATKLAPVCFSIKKPKEVEILPLEKRSALLLEESSEEGEGEEDGEGRGDQVGDEAESKAWAKQMFVEKADQCPSEAVDGSVNVDTCQDVAVAAEVNKETAVTEKSERDLVESPGKNEVAKNEPPKLENEPASAHATTQSVVSRDTHLTPPGIDDVEKDPLMDFGDSNSPGGLSPASAASRERQLQQERKRKAAIFLRMIKKEHPPESTTKTLQSTCISDSASKTNPAIETIVVDDDDEDSYASIPSPPIISLQKGSVPCPPLIRKDEWNFPVPVSSGHNGVSSHGNREKSYRKVHTSENDGHEDPAVAHRRHHHHHRTHKHKHKHRKESASPLSPPTVHKRAHSRSRSKSKTRSDRPWKEGSSAPKHKKGKKKKARSRSRSSSRRHSLEQGHHHHHHKKSKHHSRHKGWRRAREEPDLNEEHQSRRHRSRSRESRYAEKPERRKAQEEVVEEGGPTSKVERRREEESSSGDDRSSRSESSDSRESRR